MELQKLHYRPKRLKRDAKAVSKQLRKHIAKVIRHSEMLTGCKMIKFEIGKSYIDSIPRGRVINRVNHCNWNKKGINGRWSARKSQGYNSMTVVAAVNDEALPHGVAKSKTQEYALWLEKELIGHYMFVAKDERLGNQTLRSGRYKTHCAAATGYVIYIAMKLIPHKEYANHLAPQSLIVSIPVPLPSTREEFIVSIPVPLPSTREEFIVSIPVLLPSTTEQFIVSIPVPLPSTTEQFIVSIPKQLPSTTEQQALIVRIPRQYSQINNTPTTTDQISPITVTAIGKVEPYTYNDAEFKEELLPRRSNNNYLFL